VDSGDIAGAAALVLRALARLDPNAAVWVLTAGLLLIYVELNRPGWIITGALGLLAALFALTSLLRLDLNVGAEALVISGVALLALDLVRRTPWIVAAAATLSLVLGLDHLVVDSGTGLVGVWTAIACGAILGAGTSILTRVARRARVNKGLD
jgi:membrane-bound serine protease (ClpP class)